MLRSVINAAPRSEEAHQAYELLAHLYIQTGQYARLATDMQRRLKDFPAREEVRRDHAALGPLLHLPDQVTARTGFAILKHNRDLFSPMTINGQPAAYFFDSGAGVSAMSESEAKRLGMEINDDAGQLATSTGHQTSFRTAVAKDFKWGAVELKNVSFAVFRDDQEPWKDLPAGRRGLIGIPALVAAQRVRWSRDGTVEVGANRGAPIGRQPNLCFDDDQLFTSVTEQGHTFSMRLDTGAVYTELWSTFAQAFPELIQNKGTKTAKDVHGIGHAEEMEAVSLPPAATRARRKERDVAPSPGAAEATGSQTVLGQRRNGSAQTNARVRDRFPHDDARTGDGPSPDTMMLPGWRGGSGHVQTASCFAARAFLERSTRAASGEAADWVI